MQAGVVPETRLKKGSGERGCQTRGRRVSHDQPFNPGHGCGARLAKATGAQIESKGDEMNRAVGILSCDLPIAVPPVCLETVWVVWVDSIQATPRLDT